MILYPTVFPVSEIQDVIHTITTGAFTSNQEAFAKDLWVISGYGLGQTIGEVPPVPAPVPTPTPTPAPKSFIAAAGAPNPVAEISDEEACDYLQQALDEHGKVGAAAAAIPWAQIIAWALPLILKLLVPA